MSEAHRSTDTETSRPPEHGHWWPTVEKRLSKITSGLTVIRAAIAVDADDIGRDAQEILTALRPLLSDLETEGWWLEQALEKHGLLDTKAPTDAQEQLEERRQLA